MKNLVLLGIVFTLLGGCGSDDDVSRSEAISALTGDTTAGKVVFDANCLTCHGAAGEGTPQSADIRGVGKSTVIDTTLSGIGAMPSFSSLSDQELADCAAYVLTF